MPKKESRGPGYERRDTNFVGIALFAGSLVVFLGVALLVSRWVDRSLVDVNRGAVPSSPMARRRRTPPEPRLQISDANDMTRLRDVENVILNNYGWIDSDRGIVRVPVDRAMDLVAEEGLPARGPVEARR